MTERHAVANGNINDTATWNGGTLPDPGDDLFANNFTVTVNVNWTANSVSTRAGTTAVAGGRFDIANGVTLTAEVRPGSSECVRFTGNTPNAATITGNILPSNTTMSSAYGARLEGTGTLTINGNVTANSLNATNQATVFAGNGVNGNIIINGDVIGSSGANTFAVFSPQCVVTVNGDVYAGTVGGNHSINLQLGTASCIVNGRVIGNNVAGNGGSNVLAKAIFCSQQTSLVRVREIVCGDRGDFPISGPFKFLTQVDALLEAIDAADARFELVKAVSAGGLFNRSIQSGGSL